MYESPLDNSKERRRFRRYESNLPAQVDLTADSRIHTLPAELRNIGLGGALITLDGHAELGASMDLNIFVYENRFGRLLRVDISQEALKIKIIGRVVRIESPEAEELQRKIALEFTSPVRFAALSLDDRTDASSMEK